MDDLFEVPMSLSPKRAWMERHGIQTQEPLAGEVAETVDQEGLNRDPWDLDKWLAWKGAGTMPGEDEAWAQGGTEEESLMALAQKLQLTTWHGG